MPFEHVEALLCVAVCLVWVPFAATAGIVEILMKKN